MLNQIELFTAPASEATLQRLDERLKEHNIEAVIVDDGEEARRIVQEKVPAGAEVYSGKSENSAGCGYY